jgi:flagellar motor component MotA
MKKFYGVGVILVLAMYVAAILSGGGEKPLLTFLSLPSLVLAVLPAVLLSLATHGVRGTGRMFSVTGEKKAVSGVELQQAVAYFKTLGGYIIASGVLGFLLGFVILLANLGGDPAIIGAGTAVGLLSVVYAVGLYMVVVLPFRLAAQSKLATADRSA